MDRGAPRLRTPVARRCPTAVHRRAAGQPDANATFGPHGDGKNVYYPRRSAPLRHPVVLGWSLTYQPGSASIGNCRNCPGQTVPDRTVVTAPGDASVTSPVGVTRGCRSWLVGNVWTLGPSLQFSWSKEAGRADAQIRPFANQFFHRTGMPNIVASGIMSWTTGLSQHLSTVDERYHAFLRPENGRLSRIAATLQDVIRSVPG